MYTALTLLRIRTNKSVRNKRRKECAFNRNHVFPWSAVHIYERACTAFGPNYVSHESYDREKVRREKRGKRCNFTKLNCNRQEKYMRNIITRLTISERLVQIKYLTQILLILIQGVTEHVGLASTADRTFKTNEGESSYKHTYVLSVFVYEIQSVFIFCYLITFTEDDENDISR